MLNIKLLDRFCEFLKILVILIVVVSLNSLSSAASTKPKTDEKFVDYINEYNRYKANFKWMTKEAYEVITKWCEIRDFDMLFVCALITYESADHPKTKFNWKKMQYVKSPSGAVGPMQLMPVHSPKNPDLRYNIDFNIEKGTWYLKSCVAKARKEGWKNIYKQACRYYNAGKGNKIKNYKNWGYVVKILKKYKEVKVRLMSVNSYRIQLGGL